MTLISTTLSSLYNPHITHLPHNGLTIITEQIPVSVVNCNIWFNLGSKMESDDINGMAHFLEHMIFKGSEGLEAGEFESIVEARGAATNAATSQEYTHFYFTCSPDDFEDILPLQIDLLSSPSLPLSEFEREKKVVLEEIRRSQDNPHRRIFDKMMETCFPNLPYHRPILGKEEIITSLSRDKMAEFHSQWYQPQGMTVVAVGGLSTEELTHHIITQLESKIGGKQPSTPVYQPESAFNSIITNDYTDHSLQQSRLIMTWRVPGLDKINETLPLDVLAVILGRGKLSRLFQDLRENRHLVHRVSVSNTSYQIQGVFSITAVLSSHDVVEVEERILNHLQDIQENGITLKELNRVCQNVANQFIFHSEKPNDRTSLYGYYYSQLRTIKDALNYVENIKKLTIEDIQQATIKYLSLSGYGRILAINDR